MAEYLPDGQSKHTVAATSAANLPAWQSTQVCDDEAPGAGECLPTGQTEQTVAPVSTANLPDGQSEQIASLTEVAFGGPNLPAAHGLPEHEVAPVAEANVPERHGVLSLVPPMQKCPAGHGAPATDDEIPAAQ